MKLSINKQTRISSLLNSNELALEKILELSEKFNKLKNPILRRIMAPRTSIEMACKIANIDIQKFLKSMQSIGFELKIDSNEIDSKNAIINEQDFDIDLSKVEYLDVRPILMSGKDPLQIILEKIEQIEVGNILCIINSFIPEPLINVLKKKGFISKVEENNPEEYKTYFLKLEKKSILDNVDNQDAWDEVINSYSGKLEYIDVRDLEMPLPMITILEKLDTMESDKLLFVYHKKIPVFLLPELTEKGYTYQTKYIDEKNVEVIIYKK